MTADKIAALYTNSAQKIMGMVDEAVKNPAAAAQLRAFTAMPNSATLTPAVRQLLGISAAAGANAALQ
jgi:hypothetical protein